LYNIRTESWKNPIELWDLKLWENLVEKSEFQIK
jgi:hypothetical protein